jgi:hypothetical protein
MAVTYARRAALLAQLRRQQADDTPSSVDLLSAAERWLQSIPPLSAFASPLLRHAAFLCAHIQHPRDERAGRLARAGLRALVEAGAAEGAPPSEGALEAATYVAGLAASDLQVHLGTGPGYLPLLAVPRVAGAVTTGSQVPQLGDAELARRARRYSAGLGALADAGLLGRLRQNVEMLAHTLENGAPTAQKATARAALRELLAKAETAGSSGVLLARLTDHHRIQAAIDQGFPERGPWPALLDAAVNTWPFLSRLVLVEEGIAAPLSEFAILNAALSCASLRRLRAPDADRVSVAASPVQDSEVGNDPLRTAVVLPTVGPLPVLLGILGALGMVEESLGRGSSGLVLGKGQMVRVDGDAVAMFDGFEERNEQRLIRLIQYTRQKTPSKKGRWSERVGTLTTLPESALPRLDLAPSGAGTRGTISRSQAASDAAVTALELLFLQPTPIQFGAFQRRVIVVTPVTRARDLVRRLEFHGQRLADALPVGHLQGDGDIEVWSARYRGRIPTLLFAPNLDLARDFIKDARDGVALVVIDGSAGCLRQAASLRSIHGEVPDAHVLLLARDQDLDQQDAWLERDCGFAFWEWAESDLRSLWWQAPAVCRPCPVAAWERRVQLAAITAPSVREVPCPAGEEAFSALNELRAVAARRDGDPLEALERFLDHSRGLLFGLLRRLTPLPPGSQAREEAGRSLAELRQLRACGYFTREEQAAAGKVLLGLERFVGALAESNPKGDALRALLKERSVRTVIVPGEAEQEELRHSNIASGLEVVTAGAAAGIEAELEGEAAVTGWVRQDRMAELISPPVAERLTLLLSSLELRWLRGYDAGRTRRRERRARRTARKSVFAGIQGWPERPQAAAASVPQTGSLDQLDALHAHIHQARRRRLLAQVQSGEGEPAEAHVVSFTDGSHALLTSGYRARVVTHLILQPQTAGNGQPDVAEKAWSELRPGDYLLFVEGSSSDVIRTVADRSLPVGTRETATLWKDALRRYQEREALTIRQLWGRLQLDGEFTHQIQTVRKWVEDDDLIAPRDARDHELDVIARVTGDQELQGRKDACAEAITQVWGKHQQVGWQLAAQVARQTAVLLTRGGLGTQPRIEIEAGVVVVCVDHIEPKPEQVSRSYVNRLLDPGE